MVYISPENLNYLASFNTTENLLYFVSVSNPQIRLGIQFVPYEITHDRVASIGDVFVIGRNNPFSTFDSGVETISMKLDFYACEENREDVRRKCNMLRSFTYKDGDKPLDRVKLIYGDLFKLEKWVVRSVKVNYSNFSKPHKYLPQQAYVDIVLKRDDDKQTTHDLIRY